MLSTRFLVTGCCALRCKLSFHIKQPFLTLFRTFCSSNIPSLDETGVKSSLFNPTQEHRMLREMMQDFVANEVEPQAMENNDNETFNVGLFKKMGELGLLAPTVCEEYGGGGLDAVYLVNFHEVQIASVIIHEELSTSDPGFGLAYLAHSILFVNNLFVNANPEQCKRFLPAMCSGDMIGGVCMTEPDGGTDVLGMKTTALRDGDVYILNGRKMWITNGNINGVLGDAYLVYALLDGKITMFVVEKGMKGFSMGQQIKHKLGMRSSGTAELVFDHVIVPVANLVGEEGKASVCMMRNLEMERVTLAAQSVGIAKRCIQVMNNYAQQRVAFGQSINRFGQVEHILSYHNQIQKMLAESYASYQAGRSFLYNVSGQLNLYQPGNRLDTDAVKLFCGPMAKCIADDAIQVMGGYGYVEEGVVERLWRDSKLLEIGGGTVCCGNSVTFRMRRITRILLRI